MRYQRHRAHLVGSTPPRNASPSPSRTTTEASSESARPSPLRVDGASLSSSAEGSSTSTVVPAGTRTSSTPTRKHGLSSPYIQNKLLTPTRKKTVQEQQSPPQPPPPPPPQSTYPKRQQQQAGSRKTDLIHRMQEKKRATNKTTQEEPTIFQQVVETQEEHTDTDTATDGDGDGDCPDDEKASEPGTATTVESDMAVDEPSCDREEASEGQSSTFDMRSILDHPPTPPPEPELSPSHEEVEYMNDASTDIAVFNPMDDQFMHELMRLAGESSQEEEKKEVEDESLPSQPLDNAWDTLNPAFEHHFASTSATTPVADDKAGNTPDMFDSSSWEEADATFLDVESHFLQLMEQASQSDSITANISYEEKQVLEDVKRNLELASSIDKADSLDLSETGKHSMSHSSSRRVKLETLNEDEASSNFDEVSLVGIVTKSEDDSPSQATKIEGSNSDVGKQSSSKQPTDSETAEVVKEDEPLLLRKASSSDEGDNTESQQISVEQRVEMYNAPNELDDESSAGDEDEDSVAEDDEDDVLDYIGQESSDDEDATIDIINPLSERTARKFGTLKDVPTFDAAAIAALTSNGGAMVELEGVSAVNAGSITEDSVSSSLHIVSEVLGNGGVLLPMSVEPKLDMQRRAMIPPPPPPPPGKKKKHRTKNKTKSSGSVPLLAPPPDEKLKKWEEEKMRGQVQLATVRAKIQAAKSDAVGIAGPPAMSRSVEPSLFLWNPTNDVKSPSEKARSPSNIDNVFADQKFAERVAMASSAAAVSFEERLVTERFSSSPDSQRGKNWGHSDVATFPFKSEEDQLQVQHPPSRKDVEQDGDGEIDDRQLLAWLSREVLGNSQVQTENQSNIPLVIRLLLEDDDNFNKMCQYMADCVNATTASLGDDASFDALTLTTTLTEDDSTVATTKSRQQLERQRPLLKPMVLSQESQKLASGLLAANFVSFLYLASKLSKVPSPFGSSNPFLSEIVSSSLQNMVTLSKRGNGGKSCSSPQQVIFDHAMGRAEFVVGFVYNVCEQSIEQSKRMDHPAATLDIHTSPESEDHTTPVSEPSTPCAGNTTRAKGLRFIVPYGHPSPFETAVWEAPRIVPAVLSFLGDPVAVCRIKMVNRYCRRLVSEHEHAIMQDAVRTGGLNMNIRPAFWMWIALQKCHQDDSTSQVRRITNSEELKQLEQDGHEGKWHHVIERDVERSFGNMPPHKTGARLRTDSIVRALVTWGQNRIMKRGVKGGGEETPLPELGPSKRPKDKPMRNTVSPPPWECAPDKFDESESSGTPTDKVSDWGPISPVASMTESSNMGFSEAEYDPFAELGIVPSEELALSGNRLTPVMKSDLQNKLRFILHSLAATHGDVGYCQGMDYVVAHLLRILQDTIRWNAVQGTLPQCIVSTSNLPDLSGWKDEPLTKVYEEVDKASVVEEVIVRVMDTFFVDYNLRHMYWPELRCLKTCCRVFERLIQIKLPVLADHFEHHDLNVGLFALGWFQTLFLYLPSMPSATVCHMWDIWLVERSFKIFFRVGTAILFLSQPILLNHELEGMMTYLNTIPDATLLKPDILIPCALNIKVTNRILQELEAEVTSAAEN